MNLDRFNKLPKDLQEVLKKRAQETERIPTENAVKTAESELEKLQKEGKRLCRLPPVQIKQLFDLAYGVTWKQVLKDDSVYGPQFINLSFKTEIH